VPSGPSPILGRTETLTFLFTDIEGSTALLTRLGEVHYAKVLADHHRIIRSRLSAHDGREVGTQGDGFFALFSSPKACAAAVIEMQENLETHGWPTGEHVRVRMGIHCGEATETSAGLVGFDVHKAARIAAVAYGGQILLSETAAALVRHSLPAGAVLSDLGLHRLKDLGRPEQIFQLGAESLPGEFPPLRSLDNPTLIHNLPAQLATFVGRSQEQREVRALVESARLVTLTGAGGSGKTRLALQVAAELLDGAGDGVWLVELASVSDGDAVALVIAQIVGIAGQPGRPALEVLLDVLSTQDIVIVLDNCEHLIRACAQVADAIMRRCPQVHLLVTSREPLGIAGESIYRVPSLSLPESDADSSTLEKSDAVSLFLDRARSQGVDLVLDKETGPLLVSTCRRLDGMPLAIELAAARLRSLSLADLHGHLDQRFRLLTGGSRSALERQQTLRATVDWSYSLLDDPERAVLRRLSVFADGFDLAAAGAVCAFGDIETFDVTDHLGSLVDKSLVVAEPLSGGLRYRMLETIRQFAVERLLDLGEDEAATVVTTHCRYFLSVAEQAAAHLSGSDQGQWLARLDADQANLRRAMEHAADDPNGSILVLRFAVALRDFWLARSRREEGFRYLEPVLARPEVAAEPRLLLRALIVGATVGRNVDIQGAQRLALRAVEMAGLVDDDRLAVRSLVALGATYFFSGDPERALPLGRECVERARPYADDDLLAISLGLYLMSSQIVDPDRSEALLAEAIACTERSGNLFYTADLRNTAAIYELQAGNVGSARAHLEQASLALQSIGVAIYHVKINLGLVLREEGDYQGAGSMLGEALRISRRGGDRFGLAYSILGLACLAADRGDWWRSAELHGVAQCFLDQIGQPWLLYYGPLRALVLDTVQAHLGHEEFQRAYSQGTATGFEEAIELALDSLPAP
jgi:predicted ATPase/class 3 adenylate cyclase